jgi:hypothetical protein
MVEGIRKHHHDYHFARQGGQGGVVGDVARSENQRRLAPVEDQRARARAAGGLEESRLPTVAVIASFSSSLFPTELQLLFPCIVRPAFRPME